MTTITNVPGPLTLAGIHSTDEVVAKTLPVDLPTDTYRTMLRVVVPVTAGDILDVEGWARVTNDTGVSRGVAGYTVGVGYHLWMYDVDNGPVSAADWPEGHRMVVVLRADAHSTAWVAGDTLTVDRDYGQLTARRWTPPAAA
jgi:hypothetical protein